MLAIWSIFGVRRNTPLGVSTVGIVRLLASTILLVCSAHATNYYIDNANPSCSDSGAHSTSQPWCDFNTFNTTTFNPGDNIYLHTNDTWNQAVTLHGSGSALGGVIRLTSYGTGNKPKITYGTSSYGTHVISGTNNSYWTITGLDIQDTSTAALDVTGTQNWSIAIWLDYTGAGPYSNITINNNEIHGSGMTHNNLLLLVQADSTSITSPAVQYLTITDNTIHDTGQWLVWIYAPLSLYDGATYQASYSYLTFKGNTLYNSSGQGVEISGNTNATVEDNRVYSTGQYTGVWPGGVSPLWMRGCNQTTFDNNEVYNNSDAGGGYDSGGIDVDWDNHYITIQSNYLHDNKGPGIEVLDNDHTSLLYNRVYNNQAATNVGPGQIALYGGGGSNPGITNATIKGNIIVLNTSGSNALATADASSNTWSGDSFSGNYELFTGSSSAYDLETNGYGLMGTVTGNSFYSSTGSSFAGTLNGTTKNSLGDWQTYTGYDSGSGQAVGTSVSQEQADFTPSGHTSNKWTYNYSTNGETSFSAMTWDEADQWWIGNETYCLIAAGWAQPGGTSCDDVLTWTAPASAGTADIGVDGDTISVEAGCGGSGVQIRILKNTTQIWPASGWQAIANGGSYTFSVITTTVAASDKLRFVTQHQGSNNNCDGITWNPWVIYH